MPAEYGSYKKFNIQDVFVLLIKYFVKLKRYLKSNRRNLDCNIYWNFQLMNSNSFIKELSNLNYVHN